MKNMLKPILIPILLVLSAVNAMAQSEKEANVKAAVESLRKAIVNGDRSELSKLTSESLSYGHSGGQIEDKTTFVETLASGKADFQRLEMKDQTIKIVENTAIVRNKWEGTIKDNQPPYDVTLGVLMVWILENGDWKLLARQAFKL